MYNSHKLTNVINGFRSTTNHIQPQRWRTCFHIQHINAAATVLMVNLQLLLRIPINQDLTVFAVKASNYTNEPGCIYKFGLFNFPHGFNHFTLVVLYAASISWM